MLVKRGVFLIPPWKFQELLPPGPLSCCFVISPKFSVLLISPGDFQVLAPRHQFRCKTPGYPTTHPVASFGIAAEIKASWEA